MLIPKSFIFYFSFFLSLFFIDFSFSQERVIVYWSNLGEFQWAKRIEKTFLEKGHVVEIFHAKPDEITDYEKELKISFPSKEDLKRFENGFQPTLVLELNQCPVSTIPAKRILFIHDIAGAKIALENPDLKRYGLVVAPGSVIPFLKGRTPHLNFFSGYPTHHYKPFTPPSLNSIFYCGFLKHDKKRGKGEQKKALEILSELHILKVFGAKKDWVDFPLSYQGFLDFEADSIHEAIKKSGACLVLHSNPHFSNQIPTARIFEAAASSAFIICDRHPFVVENFKDSVFYVDRDAKGKILATDILKHYLWIKKNPQEAALKAKKAHEIFEKNFTLEKFIDDILEEVFPEKYSSQTTKTKLVK